MEVHDFRFGGDYGWPKLVEGWWRVAIGDGGPQGGTIKGQRSDGKGV